VLGVRGGAAVNLDEDTPPLCSCERRPVEWNHRTNRPMRMCEQCAAEEEGDRRCKERREEGWR